MSSLEANSISDQQNEQNAHDVSLFLQQPNSQEQPQNMNLHSQDEYLLQDPPQIIENPPEEQQPPQSQHISLIRMSSQLPSLLQTFSEDTINNTSIEVQPFYMRVQEDGILVDSEDVIFEIASNRVETFEAHKDQIVHFGTVVVKPEFAVNSHNLILTVHASNISFESDFSSVDQDITAQFKVFDMEQYKDNSNYFLQACMIKKALLRNHIKRTNEINGISNEPQVWRMLTKDYKEEQERQRIQQAQLDAQQAKKLMKQQSRPAAAVVQKKSKSDVSNSGSAAPQVMGVEEETKNNLNSNDNFVVDDEELFQEVFIKDDGHPKQLSAKRVKQIPVTSESQDEDESASPNSKFPRDGKKSPVASAKKQQRSSASRDQMNREEREIMKKEALERLEEIREREAKELEEQSNIVAAKQAEQKRKIDKLQQFVLKREFLVYIGNGNFTKKPEVRNSILPRDPGDPNQLKKYSLVSVRHLEQQYK